MARTENNQNRRKDDAKIEKVQEEFVDKLVHVNRVAKTVKGGRRMAFAALVVVFFAAGFVAFFAAGFFATAIIEMI